MADERASGQAGQEEGSPAEVVEALQGMLVPLRQGEFSEKIGKISVYVKSSAKSRDLKSLSNFVRFAHLNLDAVLVQALEVLVWRPRLASKTDEQKKAVALQKTFDRLDNPMQAMLEHYRSSSDPLNKYLVAGPWGHEYLRKRKVDLEEYDKELCELLGCGETAAGRIVLSYTRLCRAIDKVEERAMQALSIEVS
ncbi:MAG: hypothetical protein NTY37_08365 [Methanothrix sp.]|nr:hypothetical protein [Methanothrix sp.]